MRKGNRRALERVRALLRPRKSGRHTSAYLSAVHDQPIPARKVRIAGGHVMEVYDGHAMPIVRPYVLEGRAA